MSNNTGNTLVALLLGATVGALAGILFAPDKGTNTRKKIKDGYDDAKNNLMHKLENARNGIKRKFSHSNGSLDESYENLISDLSDTGEDLISFLENKLEDLKKQKAKLQN